MEHPPKRVIALGFFDGVHKGHGALLRRVTRLAGELGAVSAALTFDAHPSQILFGAAVPLLSSCDERLELMRRLYGVEDVIVAHCDAQLLRTPWRQFLDDLTQKYNAVHLVAGHDFRFGHRGEGDPARLAAWCREHGLGCDVIEPVTEQGMLVSSTYIRELVSAGDMERAAAFLGHPHTLTGAVRHGKHLGSALGFPTVNLALPGEIVVPARGVYATRVCVDDRSYPAVTNVGVRPSVDDGGELTAESFLLDFDGDLYGKTVRLEFFKFLRPERRFDGLDALRGQIARDAEHTREYFNT